MSGQITLGELIALLEKLLEEKSIRFDFEYAKPTKFESWRGVYAELAICFTFEYPIITVGSLLREARSAVGNYFIGYKGGEFIMHLDTPLWVANTGNSGSTAVFGVIDTPYEAIITTGHCDRFYY